MDTHTALTHELTGNAAAFRARLTTEYADLFKTDPEYAYSAAHTSPEVLADKMTRGLLTGGANKDGAGIRRACKALGVPHTYKALRAFLTPDAIELKG